jgi:hypothetical protein
MTPDIQGNEQPGGTPTLRPSEDKWTSYTFKFSVFFAFFWCIFGLSIIYGIRIWWNSPSHPTFVPFMGVGFAVIVAFAIVLTLKYATGESIEFKLFGNEWKGASGPIFLWVACFLAIVYGLYLLGVAEVFKTDAFKREAPNYKPLQHLDSGLQPSTRKTYERV